MDSRYRYRTCAVCQQTLQIYAFAPKHKACKDCETSASPLVLKQTHQKKEDLLIGMRQCIICKNLKPIAEFESQVKYCRACTEKGQERKHEIVKTIGRKTYYRNKEKQRQKNLERAEDPSAARSCSRCRQEFPWSEYVLPSGYRTAYCKDCFRQYQTERRATKDPEIRQKELQQNNQRRRERYSTDPEYREKVKSRLRAKFPDQVEYSRYLRDRRLNMTPEQKEKLVQRRRNYARTHPEKPAMYARRRRALRKGVTVEKFDEIVHKETLMRWQQNRCFYCNALLTKYHLDHIIPLVNKGFHTPGNLVLTCVRCNSQKRSRLFSKEWMPDQKITLDNYFIDDPDIPDNCRVLSTFVVSDRNLDQNVWLIPNLKKENPETFFFFDWEWWEKKEIIQKMMEVKNGQVDSVFARKTEVAEVSPEIAKEFFDMTHLQGFGRGSLYLGLTDSSRELVALSAWQNREDECELTRLSFSKHVTGGFGKLVQAFLRTGHSEGRSICSFVDTRYATGLSYEKVGFVYSGMEPIPRYYYVNGTGIYHRRNFQRKYIQQYCSFFDENLTEKMNMKINGYFQVFGGIRKKYYLDV